MNLLAFQPADLATIRHIPFFFIIGRARSGTTLLRTMFDAHPQVCIPIEAPLILHLAEKYAYRRRWAEQDLSGFWDDVRRVKDFEKWEVDQDLLRRNLLMCQGECSFSTLIRLVYLHYPSLFDKGAVTWIGDKNPVYSVNIRRISRLFPEARYIHLTRDYRDHILSMIRTRLFTPVVMFLAYRWKYSIRQMERFASRHPGRVFTLSYASLVSQPEIKLREMCDFLGLDYDPGMISFHQTAREVYKEKVEPQLEDHHKKVFSPVATDRLDLWKTEMLDTDVRVADFVVGKYAERAGYSRKYKKADFRLWFRLLPGIIYEKGSYGLKYLSDVTPYCLKARIRKVFPRLLHRLSNAGK